MVNKWIRYKDWIIPAKYPIEIKTESKIRFRVFIYFEKHKFYCDLVIPPDIKAEWTYDEVILDLQEELKGRLKEFFLCQGDAWFDIEKEWNRLCSQKFYKTKEHFKKLEEEEEKKNNKV